MKPVISIWGFGPIYRRRVKLNILEAVNSGFDDIMDYVILTDYPDDFTDFAKENKCVKAVIDVHHERSLHPWSKDLEYIPPSFNDEKAYAQEYKQAMSEGKFFNYSLHRFSFPMIAALGYNKIVFMDGDVKIKYDQIGKNITKEEFWAAFDTPPNTMKGCVAESIKFEPQVDGSTKFITSMGVGSCQSRNALQLANVLVYEAMGKYGPGKEYTHIVDQLDVCEGPFRYYHFESSDKVHDYFNVWNDNIRICLSNQIFRNAQMCGGYMLCDYIPVAATNYFFGIKVLNFPNTVYQRQIMYEDRVFIPPRAAGLSENFQEALTQEEFMSVNKDIITRLKDLKAWPHVEPY